MGKKLLERLKFANENDIVDPEDVHPLDDKPVMTVMTTEMEFDHDFDEEDAKLIKEKPKKGDAAGGDSKAPKSKLGNKKPGLRDVREEVKK